MRALVFQHVDCEHPGLFGDLLHVVGASITVVRLDAGDAIPDPTAYDALLVFGGPMNVDEEAAHPWLAAENAAIQRAIQAGQPFLGVCLGAQLLAKALGASVTANPVPEVGFDTVTLTPAGRADPLFRGCPPALPVFQWHGDTFALPAGARLLATAPACAHQAFRHGACAYGLQFHVEVTAPMVAAWGEIPAYRAALKRLHGPDGPAALACAASAALPAVHAAARILFANFLTLVRERGTQPPP
ncbi:MAG TPA: type 1 glutamine amidotransferase [Chloroflexota bacterium]|jgi:GMP synthase-like glutamine amidotransferase